MRSRFAEDQIERPAAADVRPRPAEMAQEVGIRAAGFFEGVGKDSEACGVKLTGRQGTLFVCGCGKAGRGRSLRCG